MGERTNEGAAEAPILMATIGAPHGIRGGVKLNVFAEDPLGLRRYNPFQTEDGRTLKLASVKRIGKAIVATIDGVADRNAAETLRGTDLFVPRARLPRPAEDEFYYVDLIGLEARLEDGTLLGTIRGVFDFGAGDMLDVAGPKAVLIPFTDAVVPTVDIAGGVVTVVAIPGLLDDEAPPDDADTGDEGDTSGASEDEGGADEGERP